MKRLIAFVLALAIAAMSAAAPVAAQPRHGLHPRPHGQHWDRRGPPPGWNKRQWEYRRRYLRRHGHRDDDHDAAIGIIAGAILGFALGAAVSDTRERQSRALSRIDDPDWIAYCARKYRSFDPRTGTYLGYDGLRHYCR